MHFFHGLFKGDQVFSLALFGTSSCYSVLQHVVFEIWIPASFLEALTEKAAFRVRQRKVNFQLHEHELSYMTCITINGGHAGKFLSTTLHIYSWVQNWHS